MNNTFNIIATLFIADGVYYIDHTNELCLMFKKTYDSLLSKCKYNFETVDTLIYNRTNSKYMQILNKNHQPIVEEWTWNPITKHYES